MSQLPAPSPNQTNLTHQQYERTIEDLRRQLERITADGMRRAALLKASVDEGIAVLPEIRAIHRKQLETEIAFIQDIDTMVQQASCSKEAKQLIESRAAYRLQRFDQDTEDAIDAIKRRLIYQIDNPPPPMQETFYYVESTIREINTPPQPPGLDPAFAPLRRKLLFCLFVYLGLLLFVYTQHGPIPVLAVVFISLWVFVLSGLSELVEKAWRKRLW